MRSLQLVLSTGQAANMAASAVRSSSGRWVRQAGTACGQRGSNAQPGMGAESTGGIPGKPRKGDPMGSDRLGIASISPIV